MSRKNLIWADNAIFSKDLSGKVYIVTGANSGVGLETTRQLIAQGARVVMACRRPDAAEDAAKSFSDLQGSYDIITLDLADLQSIRTFVDEFLQKYDRLDGLDCNAGLVVMNNKVQHTNDGLELTMAVSYFGHFLLTELLLDILKKSVPSRMIILSSVVHAGNPKNRYSIHLEDLNYHTRTFSNFTAYGEAKVATVLYAKELAERLKNTGVFTASVHPGWARSNFGQGGSIFIRALMGIMRPLTHFMSDSNWESAQAPLHCLLSDDALNHSGAYFSQSSVLYRDKECVNGGWPLESPNPHAKDINLAKQLVEKSYEIVGLG